MTSEDINISHDGKDENKSFKPNDLIITSDLGLLMAKLGESGYAWEEVGDLTPIPGAKGDTPIFEVRSGDNINKVGTPSITITTDESVGTPKNILTFNYLKGEKGDSCGFKKTNILKGIPNYSYNGIASQDTTITIDFSLDTSNISRGLTVEFSFKKLLQTVTGKELIRSSGYVTAGSLIDLINDTDIQTSPVAIDKKYCYLYVESIFGKNHFYGSTKLYYIPQDGKFRIEAHANTDEEEASQINLEKVILSEIVKTTN